MKFFTQARVGHVQNDQTGEKKWAIEILAIGFDTEDEAKIHLDDLRNLLNEKFNYNLETVQ